MKVFFWNISLFLLLLVGCQSEKKYSDSQSALSDSTDVSPDSIAGEGETAPPKSADGLFDDFIYAFMRNRTFQYERIVFPLTNRVDGVDKPIDKRNWKFDAMYVNQDVYTLIFDDARSVNAEKDTTLLHVVVEWVYLDQRRVKQYHFEKQQGQWRLTALDTHGLEKHGNSDFYEFYRQFSTSERFQRQHISNPFHFKTYDFDNFQNIEGLLDVSQWPDYRPDLPKGVITNINYGQKYGNARQRVLLICSPSGGMGCAITFVRNGKTWVLNRLEN